MTRALGAVGCFVLVLLPQVLLNGWGGFLVMAVALVFIVLLMACLGAWIYGDWLAVLRRLGTLHDKK